MKKIIILLLLLILFSACTEQKYNFILPEKIIENNITNIVFVCHNGTITDDRSDCIIQETQYEERIIYQYVCPNGSTRKTKQECFPDILKINESEEKNNLIKDVEILPACINGENGGTIYFKGPLGKTVSIEAKQKEQPEFSKVLNLSSVSTAKAEFSICIRCFKGDFELIPDKEYEIRISFLQKNTTTYSSTYTIDTNKGTIFTQKACNQLPK